MDIENQGELGTEYEILSSDDSYSYSYSYSNCAEESNQERLMTQLVRQLSECVKQLSKCVKTVKVLNKIADCIIYLALTVGLSAIGVIATISISAGN